MTDRTIDLDHHRGMAAQKATELRRLLANVEANENELRHRQDELEAHLLAAPAVNWHDAADKARGRSVKPATARSSRSCSRRADWCFAPKS